MDCYPESQRMQHDLILIGTGKLAAKLIERLASNSHFRLFLCGRNKSSLEQLLKAHPGVASIELSAIPRESTCILCVSDSSISLISNELNGRDCFLIHNSGAVFIDVLIPNGAGAAVIWPLQSFTDLPINWNEIPLIVELSSQDDTSRIQAIIDTLGGSVNYLDSNRRRKLHLAAVMVNNFSNYLFQVAQEYCIQENLPFETLKSLIHETVNRIGNGFIADFQTGPASREDLETVSKHIELLNDNADAKKLYEFMSNAIIVAKKTRGR